MVSLPLWKKKKKWRKKQSLMRTFCPPHVFLLVSEYWVNQKTYSRFHLLSFLTVLSMLKTPTYIKYFIVSVCFFSIFVTCPISPLHSPLLPSLHQQRDSFNSPFNKERASRATWERWPCPRKQEVQWSHGLRLHQPFSFHLKNHQTCQG